MEIQGNKVVFDMQLYVGRVLFCENGFVYSTSGSIKSLKGQWMDALRCVGRVRVGDLKLFKFKADWTKIISQFLETGSGVKFLRFGDDYIVAFKDDKVLAGCECSENPSQWMNNLEWEHSVLPLEE